MYNKKLAVIIPAYNECYSIAKVVRSLQTALQQAKINPYIIVVDDASTDNTAKRAQKSGAFVIRHIFNTGPGGAVATGLRYARDHNFELAVTVDADGQHDANDVINGVYFINDNGGDLVIGSRMVNTSGMPFVKVIGNQGLNVITRVLFGSKVSDSQSGLRVFSSRAISQLRWKNDGHGYCSEMIWRAKQQNLTIKEYPIRAIYSEYSRSKGQNNWNVIQIIRSLLKWRIIELFGE